MGQQIDSFDEFIRYTIQELVYDTGEITMTPEDQFIIGQDVAQVYLTTNIAKNIGNWKVMQMFDVVISVEVFFSKFISLTDFPDFHIVVSITHFLPLSIVLYFLDFSFPLSLSLLSVFLHRKIR